MEAERMGLFDKLAKLTDEQLLECLRALEGVKAYLAWFYREALAMEYERRHGEGSVDAIAPVAKWVPEGGNASESLAPEVKAAAADSPGPRLGARVMGLFEELAKLTDEQLLECLRALEDAKTDVLRFYREALAMEYERRHGEGSVDAIAPPFGRRVKEGGNTAESLPSDVKAAAADTDTPADTPSPPGTWPRD